jgi:hypothetical protein
MSHGLDQSEMLRLLGYNIAQAAIPAYRLFETLIGLPLGILCGTFALFSRLSEPFVDFVRYFSSFSYFSLSLSSSLTRFDPGLQFSPIPYSRIVSS